MSYHVTQENANTLRQVCTCTYEWDMSHIWMRRLTEENESALRQVCAWTYEWVMSHMRISFVTHVNESWTYVWMDVRASGCTCEWMYITPDVRMYTWMSRVTHVNESCHTREWVVSHTWMSHLTHVNESCHTRAYIYRTYLSVRTWVQTHSPPQKKTNPGDVFVFAQGYFVISSV